MEMLPSVFFFMFFAKHADNFDSFHGSSKPGKRSFGRFSRPLLEGYLNTQNQYRNIAKSLAVAEVNPLLQGISAFMESFCVLEQKYKRGVIQHIFRRSHGQTESQQWQQVRLGDIFKKVSRRNTDGKIKNVITNSAEYGLIPQRDFFDKDIAIEGNTENYYVIENGDFVYNPRKSITAPYGPFNRYTLKDQGIISPLSRSFIRRIRITTS